MNVLYSDLHNYVFIESYNSIRCCRLNGLTKHPRSDPFRVPNPSFRNSKYLLNSYISVVLFIAIKFSLGFFDLLPLALLNN